ncbi:protein of unknown function (plasmid) [Caballeronia sp. S22]
MSVAIACAASHKGSAQSSPPPLAQKLAQRLQWAYWKERECDQLRFSRGTRLKRFMCLTDIHCVQDEHHRGSLRP